MSKIIELTESEASYLMVALSAMRDYQTIKVNVDGDGFKYKIGEGMWTPSLGHVLPGSTGSEPTDPNFRLTQLTVCLACDDGDHQTCYGTGCNCGCQGEFV